MLNLSNVRLRIWTNTAANWASANPVLGRGEIGLVVDESGNATAMRIGNGTSAFGSLTDFSTGGGGGGGSMTGEQIVTAVTALDSPTMLSFVSTLLTAVLTPSSLLSVDAAGELAAIPVSEGVAVPGTLLYWPVGGGEGQFISISDLLDLLDGDRNQSNNTVLVKEGDIVVEKSYTDLWTLLYTTAASTEAVQEAPFASNVITLNTEINSRFVRTTNLSADCSLHSDSWIGLTDSGRTAELRLQTGGTGYNLTVPSGTVFYNQPSSVLEPNKFHRFLLGRDGTTPTIYYAGSGVVI